MEGEGQEGYAEDPGSWLEGGYGAAGLFRLVGPLPHPAPHSLDCLLVALCPQGVESSSPRALEEKSPRNGRAGYLYPIPVPSAALPTAQGARASSRHGSSGYRLVSQQSHQASSQPRSGSGEGRGRGARGRGSKRWEAREAAGRELTVKSREAGKGRRCLLRPAGARPGPSRRQPLSYEGKGTSSKGAAEPSLPACPPVRRVPSRGPPPLPVQPLLAPAAAGGAGQQSLFLFRSGRGPGLGSGLPTRAWSSRARAPTSPSRGVLASRRVLCLCPAARLPGVYKPRGRRGRSQRRALPAASWAEPPASTAGKELTLGYR